MGKAYTEKEREKIREQLLEAGLELFHEAGVRDINIRELTRRVGIAQGGFYNFFPDKEALVRELIYYRTEQKIRLFEEMFPQSEKDPAAFVSDAVFAFAWDLKKKAEQKQMYADILQLYIREKPSEKERLYAFLHEAFQRLAAYWEKQGLSIAVDIQGVLNVIRGVLTLLANLGEIDGAYTETIIKTFVEANCRNYIRTADKQKTVCP